MAAVGSEEDCKCPVCREIFQEPVMLTCGHSFCDNCVRESWRHSSQRACPVCRKISPTAQPPRNLALWNLVETFRESQNDAADMCSVHDEKLKLFCEEDQQLICVICRDSKHHKTHNCLPVNEVAETHRNQLKSQLTNLKSKVDKFKSEKTKLNGMEIQIKDQTVQTEKAIQEEFQKLYRFLKDEETARIDALRKEGAQKSKLIKENIAKLESGISTLSQKITKTEKEIRAKDIPFMQNVKDTIKLSRCDLTGPKTPKDAVINEAKHLGNLLFIVWMKVENWIGYVPVTLDPNTDTKPLTISQVIRRQQLDNTVEKLREVLVSEGFKSGKHFWDVQVGYSWTLGVAEEPSKCSTSRNVWGIIRQRSSLRICKPTPEDENSDVLGETLFLKRIRVLLDYNQGTLSFFDLDKKTVVHTIKHTFTNTVFPYFKTNNYFIEWLGNFYLS